ncbi:hypothetical protein FSP39_018474 [Pinctada imbricata]|nr:hypothetical protein FSP39_018474 [Pinctada imbricata]
MLFCFLPLLQDELDSAARTWDNHRIRCSRNQVVPSGRPTVLFNFPVLWNKTDKICTVSRERFILCKEEAEFRSTIPCDPDVYQACVHVMQSSNLRPAKNAEEGVTLYLCLRRHILTILST